MRRRRVWALGVVVGLLITPLAVRAEAPEGPEAPEALEVPGAATEGALSLGAVGVLDVPAPWRVVASQPIASPLGVGDGVGATLVHPAGGGCLLVALTQSQALSLHGVAREATGAAPALVEHAGQWWWDAAGGGARVLTTGWGASSVVCEVSGPVPEADLSALLAGLALERPMERIDETWIAFDLPDVRYVHQLAAPYSWTRGAGIVAVDVSFDRSFDERFPTADALADLAPALPEWSLVVGRVRRGGEGLGARQAEDLERELKSYVAPPGSNAGADVVAFLREEGILRVELRAEGPDGPLVARNELAAIAATLEIKPRYDWWYGARKKRFVRHKQLAAEMAAEAAPLLGEAFTTVQSLVGGGSLAAPGVNGLTGLQALPMLGFAAFEIGRAKTPTEDTTATVLGYTPYARYALRDYFGEGTELASTSVGIGASIAAATRVFGLRGQVIADWNLHWPHQGRDHTLVTDDAIAESPTDGRYQPLWVRLRSGFHVDPTTHLIPHRFGAFGDWQMGIGLGVNLDLSQAHYTSHTGDEEKILFWNTAFTPSAGFQTRLFWGLVHLWGRGYLTPAQLGLTTVARDTALRTEVEQGFDAGEQPNLGQLFAQSGMSGMVARTMGTAAFAGARGVQLGAVVGVPFPSNLRPPIRYGYPKDQGATPPLASKVGRATFLNTLGVGVSWYWEETRYTPFATPHGASGADARFGTVNTGLVVGIGSTATALPAFGSGRR